MFNFIRKVLATYAETEKQLLQLRCLVLDNGQTIRKTIKSISRKYRNDARQYVIIWAELGYSKNEIINKLLEYFK